MLRLCLLFIGTLLLPGNSFAQNKNIVPVQTKYQEGVESFKKGQYEQTLKILGPLTREEADPQYSTYAHYYYALSLYHLKKYNESVSMLRQLQSRATDWNKDDVNYLLGANNMAAGYLLKGIEFLNRVGGKAYAADIQGLKQNFLSKVTNLTDLKSLQKQYPQDKTVAESLVLLITQSSHSTAGDIELAASLIKRFEIKQVATETTPKKKKDSESPIIKKRKDKGDITVSVLLPFRLQEFLVSNKARSNQFAYDYYQGLLLAAEKLQSEGMKLNLQTYDVGNEDDLAVNLTKDPSFQESELIIGPLYQKSIDILQRFSEKNKITMVNPLSTDGSLLSNSKYVFLTHPSLDTQMKQVWKVAKDIAASPSALIFYGNTSKDSLMAAIYEKELIKNGGNVVEKVRFSNGTDTLASKIPELGIKKPTHILLFSSDIKSGPSLMTGLSSRHLQDIPVIATSISFDFQRHKPQYYGKRLFLIETEDLNLNKSSVVEFQQKYWNFSNTLPSIYAVQGYDHLLFFIRMLVKYRTDPQLGITLRRYTDEEFLLSGFDFTDSRDNAQNSILKYDGGWVKY